MSRPGSDFNDAIEDLIAELKQHYPSSSSPTHAAGIAVSDPRRSSPEPLVSRAVSGGRDTEISSPPDQ